jgi:carbamoyltransferase
LKKQKTLRNLLLTVANMDTLILGLHGLMPGTQMPGVHDAAFCLLDGRERRMESLIEMEKLSGIRHDGRLDLTLLNEHLSCFPKRELDLATSHFTALDGNIPRHFPLYKDVQTLDFSDLTFSEEKKSFLLGRSCRQYVYLHELAHVFSAFMFRKKDHDEFLGLVIEGSGAFSQSCLFRIAGFKVELLEYNLPVLSGHFFHQWLSRLVFDVKRKDYLGRTSTPGKVMALAAYGDPDRFRGQLLSAMEKYPRRAYINYRDNFCPEIENLNLSWTDRVDLCASGQALFEELIAREGMRIRRQYGNLPLYYAGGCALSVKANSRLHAIFDELVIPPNCADDGQALGLAAMHAFLKYKVPPPPLSFETSIQSNIRKDLNLGRHLSTADLQRVVTWLADGKIVGWAQGMPEIGPRALCRRSVLASPENIEMKQMFNHIKEREYFRPVSPVVLHTAGKELFRNYFFSPHMLYDFPVRPKWRNKLQAAIHKDGTARVQSVPDDHSDIAILLKSFAEQTGRPPVLLNTSLNCKGMPIASTPEQVKQTFSHLKINHYVIGNRAIEACNLQTFME